MELTFEETSCLLPEVSIKHLLHFQLRDRGCLPAILLTLPIEVRSHVAGVATFISRITGTFVDAPAVLSAYATMGTLQMEPLTCTMHHADGL